MYNRHTLRLTAFIAALLSAPLALAGQAAPSPYAPTLVGGGDETETQGYVGLRWDIPGPLAPSLILGVRRAKTDQDDDTRGADLSMAFRFAGGFAPEKLRFKGFKGDTDLQGELGVGYDFATGSLFAGPSLTIPYATFGLDVQNRGLHGYGIVHSFGKPDEPGAGTPTCPNDPGDLFNPATGLCDPGIAPPGGLD